jgi:peptidoglycan/LPS O-acetylase OafA/YrhL
VTRVPRGTRRGPGSARGPVAAGLGVAALLLLEVGLLMHEAGRTVWGRSTLWAAFATVAAVAGLAAVAGARAAAPLRDRAWTLGAGGFTGLAVFWVLVALPGAGTDRGFVLTAALACLGGAVWLTSGRAAGAAAPAVPVERDPEPTGEPATSA